MTPPASATPELRAWILEQAGAGCRAEDVLYAMRASGWEPAVAQRALEDTLREAPEYAAAMGLGPAPPRAPVPPGPAGAPQPQHPAEPAYPGPALEAAVEVPEPDLERSPARIWAHDREVGVVLSLQRPRLVVFDGLLSHEECDALVAAARPRMARSETVVYGSGGNEVNPSRTSDGMFFGREETELCARIEARLAALLRWPLSHGEGLQVLRYRPGAEYKPHHDFFDPQRPGMQSVLRRGGQRVATMVMYLNTPDRGGATIFPDVGLEVAPRKGHAVFFSYARAHPSSCTLHGGAPVLEGEKWVATKWLRQREFV